MPNGCPPLWQCLRGLEHGIERPGVRLRRAAGRIHRLHIDAGELLHQVDARARALDLAADGRRHREPLAVEPREIFDRRVDLAVLLGQLGHDVVDRLETAGVRLRLPGREREDVVAGTRLRLGGDGEQVLVALRGDVVDRDFDLILLRPTPRTSPWWCCWRPEPSGPRSRSTVCPRHARRERRARRPRAVVASAVFSSRVRREIRDCSIGTSLVPDSPAAVRLSFRCCETLHHLPLSA